jgi:DNA-binding CsgD family transcriptional regulator
MEPTIEDYIDAAQQERRAGLTPMQVRVLNLIADGHSTDQIGRFLHLSDTSVRKHAARLERSLAARNRAHAVAIAFRRGILTKGATS